jgi:hypothetical protein
MARDTFIDIPAEEDKNKEEEEELDAVVLASTDGTAAGGEE